MRRYTSGPAGSRSQVRPGRPAPSAARPRSAVCSPRCAPHTDRGATLIAARPSHASNSSSTARRIISRPPSLARTDSVSRGCSPTPTDSICSTQATRATAERSRTPTERPKPVLALIPVPFLARPHTFLSHCYREAGSRRLRRRHASAEPCPGPRESGDATRVGRLPPANGRRRTFMPATQVGSLLISGALRSVGSPAPAARLRRNAPPTE